MKIITRYIIREFIKPLVFSATAFGGLVLISEFFRELNFYIEKKASFVDVFQYLFLNLPWWIIQVLPVAVLLAVLFSLSGLVKSGEITALKAAGINIWRIIGVFFACGLVIAILDISARETVIPYAIKRAENIRAEKIRREKKILKTEYRNLVVSLPDKGKMTIGRLDASKSTISQVVIDYYDNNFHLTSQLVAEKGSWKEGVWTLENGVQRVFNQELFEEEPFAQKKLDLPFKPEDFIIVKQRPEHMSSNEYKKYIAQLNTLGISTQRQNIQLNLRFSSAFSHLIVMLIGIPFALGLGSKHGKIISFTFALIFAFFYWGIQAVGQSLGENAMAPLLLSAWLGNIIFGALGTILLVRIKK